MRRFVDKAGENLISKSVDWQCEQSNEMMANIGQWSVFFSEDSVSLRCEKTDSGWHGDIPKRLIPFLTGIATGKSLGYLCSVIQAHNIQVKDLTKLTFSTSDAAPHTFGDGFVSLKGEMIFKLFAKAIHAMRQMQNLYEDAISDERSYRIHCALTHIESADAWHANKFESAGKDKRLALARLQQMPNQIDFSDPDNWPNGKAKLLLERSGAYTNYVLNHNHDGSSTWWQIMSNRPRLYNNEARIDYYSNIFSAYEDGDNRLLRGLRSIQAHPNVDSGQILYQLTCMLKASEKIPAIQDTLLNELMLTKAFSDPQNTNLETMCIGDWVVLDKSSIDPRLIAMLTRNTESFLAKVCLELMNIPAQEFSQSDLMSVITAKSLNLTEQDLSSIDINSFVKHLMSAFSAQKPYYTEHEFKAIRDAQIETVKYLAGKHELSKSWLDTLTGYDLEVMVMAGLGDKKKLSAPALGRVFSADLGL